MTPITRSNKWWRLPLPRDTETSDTGQGQSVASHIIMGSQDTLSLYFDDRFSAKLRFFDSVVDTALVHVSVSSMKENSCSSSLIPIRYDI